MDIREKLKDAILNISKEKLDNTLQVGETISEILSDKTFHEQFSEDFLTSVGEILECYDEHDIGAYFVSEVSK